MKDLKIDPEFQSLIFPLADSEKELLEKSLIEEGCRDALIIWRGILLDGHHRFEICQRYEIEFETREIELEDRATAKIWILNNQLARRNLTPFQRAEITLRLKPLIADKAKEKQTSSRNLEKVHTDKALASTAGVSHDTIWKTEKILESKPDDKTLDELRQGEESINSAWRKITAKIEKEKRKEEEENRRTSVVSILDIRKGDFQEVLNDLENIDAIITDPPYPKQYIECFSRLSKFASKKLKPDGFIAVYSGQYHLPEVINRLSEYLSYVWTFCLYHVGKKQIVNGVNIMCGWKPILLFSRGKKKMRYSAYDVLISEVMEKHSHKWQQSESGVKPLIEALSLPGDLIVDPFAGSGTFLKVAHDMDRKAIGAEIL